MKKKLIIVSTALWIGGIETALVNLLREMDYEKFEVTCLIVRASLEMKEQIDPRCRLLIADREQVYSFDKAYSYQKLAHLTEESAHPSKLHQRMMWAVPAIRFIENLLYIRYIREQMKGEHFDTAIIFSDVVAELTLKAIKADRYLMFYHHGGMRHVYHDTIAYRKCDKIIAVSENLAEELRAFVPSAREKICALHNFTAYEKVREKAEERTAETFSKDQIHLVTVGRMAVEKGMDLAVEACDLLVKAGYKDFCWWLIGDGPEFKKVRTLVGERKLQDHIRMVGMQANPYAYIRQADLYVQPGRVEAFGLTIKEALILGKAVVATKTAGAREIVADQETGILCDISAQAIADGVRVLLEDSDFRKKVTENLKHIDWQKENQELKDKLSALL